MFAAGRNHTGKAQGIGLLVIGIVISFVPRFFVSAIVSPSLRATPVCLAITGVLRREWSCRPGVRRDANSIRHTDLSPDSADKREKVSACGHVDHPATTFAVIESRRRI
jgi:hypothetical protein